MSCADGPLVMKHDADERAVNVHATAVVVNEAELSEPIHEEADARTRGADHLGEGFLADLRDDRYRLGFLAEVGQQQEKPRETFFAGVEEVIYQIRFHANVAGKQVSEKAFSKFRFADEVCLTLLASPPE